VLDALNTLERRASARRSLDPRLSALAATAMPATRPPPHRHEQHVSPAPLQHLESHRSWPSRSPRRRRVHEVQLPLLGSCWAWLRASSSVSPNKHDFAPKPGCAPPSRRA
jgi:hypothetical protein